MLKDIKEGNRRTKWKDREPFAYWRGNPTVARTRADLMKCNVTDKTDWNTRLFVQVLRHKPKKISLFVTDKSPFFLLQDWNAESKIGYKRSNLEDQCTYRL